MPGPLQHYAAWPTRYANGHTDAAVADRYGLAMATMPTRVDGDLFEAAKATGAVYSRSAAQQLAHWARLGRELEASTSVAHDAIARVLARQASYDELPDPAQAVVRVEWDDRVAATLAQLDFRESLHAAGKPWAEAERGRQSRHA